MPKLVMVRLNGIARPADELSEDRFLSIPNRSEFVADIRAPRNLKHLKWVHVLLAKIAKGVEESPEEVKKNLKRYSGQYREFIARDGRVFYELESISPETMDEVRWRECWEQWRRVIIDRYLPAIQDPAIRNEVEAMLFS